MRAGANAAAGDPRPTVLYIAGSGRSGSTLVERILGACPGFVNVGELLNLFRWVAPNNERCGCGEPFSSCAFWQGVGERAFGGWSPQIIEQVTALQARVARQRWLPRLLAHPHGGRRFGRDLGAYHELYQRLYRAIGDQAGAGVVVDASKWSAQGLALAKAAELDVRVLHLVRDVRGVAYSWARSGVARPHAAGVGSARASMDTHPVARSALSWSACQAQAEAVGHVVPHYSRVRYEDFVAEPVRTMQDTLRRLNLPLGEAGLAHLSDDGVTLMSATGSAATRPGSVSDTSPLHWTPDGETRWNANHRLVASMVGMPALLKYGYVASRLSGAAG